MFKFGYFFNERLLSCLFFLKVYEYNAQADSAQISMKTPDEEVDNLPIVKTLHVGTKVGNRASYV